MLRGAAWTVNYSVLLQQLLHAVSRILRFTTAAVQAATNHTVSHSQYEREKNTTKIANH